MYYVRFWPLADIGYRWGAAHRTNGRVVHRSSYVDR